ncbi:MAG TPA: AraC family transcriptional regulator [Bacillota bacterium]|nr:AraC family transcriptional regulator [Bacillota bacterium]
MDEPKCKEEGSFMNRMLVYFYDDVAVLYGRVIDMEPHRHHFIQLSVGLEKTFNLLVGNHSYNERVMVLQHDVTHQFVGEDQQQLILLIDPNSSPGLMIKNMFSHNQNIIINNDYIAQVCKERLGNKQLTFEEMYQFAHHLLHIFIGESTSSIKTHHDTRVLQAQKIIGHKPATISMQQLIQKIFISESRLSHLFSEQVGISIKKYTLWQKLLKSLRAIRNGNTFTSAAHKGGFSDSAHLARTFKHMFGVTLTEVFNNSRNVQVIFS